MCVCVCVRTRVCTRARAIEGDRERAGEMHEVKAKILLSNSRHIVHLLQIFFFQNLICLHFYNTKYTWPNTTPKKINYVKIHGQKKRGEKRRHNFLSTFFSETCTFAPERQFG